MAAPASSPVKRILARATEGDPSVSEKLLPLVYQELRQLARQLLADEPSAEKPLPTSLVHQAYLRLIGDEALRWSSRGHFFRAAAEAMRRILVERARRRRRLKHGGDRKRVPLVEVVSPPRGSAVDLIALDNALERLRGVDPRKADIVKLRYFAGLSVEETAKALGLSPRTAKSEWRYARAWLYRELDAKEREP
ncbi:MAG: ECF-type sigma factor [Planctomycetota bacterium]|jgi:RNA polymerase sigma factor (TIGR02999 family)